MSTDHDDEGRNGEVVPIRAERRELPPGEAPKVIQADITSHPWTEAPVRKPVLPPWLRHRDQRASAAKWAAVHVAHTGAWHAVRLPKHVTRHALRSPAGLVKVLYHGWRWTFDREAHPLRVAAVAAGDAKGYTALASIRRDRVRHRLAVIISASLAVGIALGTMAAAVPGTRWYLLAAAVLVLGYLGKPEGRPVLDHAVVGGQAERLTPDIIIRALGALSISGIDRVLAKGGSINFVSPVHRDGPGWRAEVDLPYGVTGTDVLERRDKLASGLRRPLSCVWPEPQAEEHSGRLVLWVGDQPLSKARQPAYPLLKGGKADLFKPVPYGTDQRMRPVVLDLMFNNLLIGSIPRQGKTVAMRNALLGCALDPIAELRVYELKGTGDLDALSKVAHHYGSGADDATIEACIGSLREVYAELIRRAKVIRDLPKDLCPQSKVTPELARKRSLRLHPLVFGIDECQEIGAHPEYGKEFADLATAIIKRGPALGIILLLATQRPDAKSLPTGITSNVGIRFCLRVMGQVENDMVLGTSSYKRGVNATLLTVLDKGIGYLVGASEAPQVVKTYNVDGPAAERICDRARQLRAGAGTLTGYAAGDTDVPAKVSLLADVAAVLSPSETELWSETICARLAELRPEMYGGMDPTGLAGQLAAYDVTTKQVWGRTADDRKANRRGVARADVLAALAASGAGASPSGTASGPDEPPASGNGPPAASSGMVLAAVPFGLPHHLAGQAAASASGLPWWFWPLGAFGLVLAAVAYRWVCKTWPYGPCLRCIGHPGKVMSPGGKHWRRCKRCRGSGQRIRLGARLLRVVEEGE